MGILRTALWAILIIFTAACGGKQNAVPRQKGYPRIDFPKHEYRMFDTTCPYRFEIPVYAGMNYNPQYTVQPCWYNLDFYPFNATLHISYHHFSRFDQFDSMFEDTRRLVYKHTIKAEDIVPFHYSNNNPNNKVTGVLYELTGNAASQLNFFVTDSARHFFRGALYFNSKTTPDSIQPVYEFIRKDLMHMLETFEWKR